MLVSHLYPDLTVSRAAAIFHVKGNMTHAEQIGVTIAALIDEDHKDIVLWIKDVLDSAANERRLWETEREARKLLEAAENPAAADNDVTVDSSKDSELPPVIRKKILAFLRDLLTFF